MGRARIRLKDIADQTGFSTNTVSLALRESPRIPEETRQIIRSAAQTLNYLPNQIAKSLVSRETKTIGLVLTDILNPTMNQTAQALELELAERGYSTLFASSNDTLSHERDAVDVFRSRQVDGILIYPTTHREIEHIRVLRRAGYPTVMLVDNPDADVDAVSVDDRRGAWKATRHLLELGHRRIGFLDSAHALGNNEKREGFQMAISQSGVDYDPALVIDPTGHSATDGFKAAAILMGLRNPPTAIFTSNDSLALGVLRWCFRNGRAVPGDLSIVGFDNIEYAEFAAVPLTSVDYAAATLARMAVDRLMRLIEAGDTLPAPRVTLIDPDLVVRESTGPLRGA
ncbi:MAG: LacI family DNA-binding transcriptional regulator [Cucumibacter sp.]